MTDPVHDPILLDLDELCERCGVDLHDIVDMVEAGIVEAEGADPSQWRFTSYAFLRIRRAARLRRELELDLPGLALSLDLLDEIEQLRRQLQALRQQLSRMQQS